MSKKPSTPKKNDKTTQAPKRSPGRPRKAPKTNVTVTAPEPVVVKAKTDHPHKVAKSLSHRPAKPATNQNAPVLKAIADLKTTLQQESKTIQDQLDGLNYKLDAVEEVVKEVRKEVKNLRGKSLLSRWRNR